MNRCVVAIGCVVSCLVTAVFAGPLNPPVGPIAPTPGPEPRIAVNAVNTPGDANSLFKITQSGSYYLTGNIAGVVGKRGIEIVASGVTLDLNGFDLVGVPAMGAFDGVGTRINGLSNIAILNGAVRNWGQDGINLGDFDAVACRVEGIRTSGNVRNGVYAGQHSVVSKCTTTGGQIGVVARIGSRLAECSATAAGVAGIAGQSGSTISNCSAILNSRIGFEVGSGSTLSNCTASFNGDSGIRVGLCCTVSDCSAYANSGAGIYAVFGCTITNCTTNVNDFSGIRADSASTISNCTASTNADIGISTLDGCTVSGCTAANNGTGISVGNGSAVQANTCKSNGGSGIIATARCKILQNTCTENGTGTPDGAGVLITGNDGHIDGNHCSLNDYGVRVTGVGNIVVRNTCQGNPANNFSIVANNRVGALVGPPFSGAINGSTGGAGVGATDPYANMAY